MKTDLKQKLVRGGTSWSRNPLLRDRIMCFPHIQHAYGDDGDCQYFLTFHSENFLSHVKLMEEDVQWFEDYSKELLSFTIQHSYSQKIFVAITHNRVHAIVLPKSKDYFKNFYRLYDDS